MFKFCIYCEGGLLYDSGEFHEYIYDTYEDAEDEAKLDIEGRVQTDKAYGQPVDNDYYWYEIEEV
jgi:hypothetical protein